MRLLHGAPGVHMRRGSQAESSEPVSIMVSSSSSKTSGELSGKPASIYLAQQLCQAAARPATTCFISNDRLSRSAFPLMVMVDVEERRRMWSGCVVLWR